MIEYLKEQLEEQKKEKEQYRNLLHGYLGLVKIEQRELPDREKKELKNVRIGGHTFAHKRRYLEHEFEKEKDVTVKV